MGQKIYVSGAMQGKPRHNVDAFLGWAERLRELGDDPISAIEIRLAHGFDPDAGLERFDLARTAAAGVNAIAGADVLLLLPCWEDSGEALVDMEIALAFGVPIVLAAAPRDLKVTYTRTPSVRFRTRP